MNNENRQLLYFVRTDIYAAACMLGAMTCKAIPDWAWMLLMVCLWMSLAAASLVLILETRSQRKEQEP